MATINDVLFASVTNTLQMPKTRVPNLIGVLPSLAVGKRQRGGANVVKTSKRRTYWLLWQGLLSCKLTSICWHIHCKETFRNIPVPSWDVTYQTLPRREWFIYDIIIPVQGEFCKWHPGWGWEYRKAFFTVYCITYLFSTISHHSNHPWSSTLVYSFRTACSLRLRKDGDLNSCCRQILFQLAD